MEKGRYRVFVSHSSKDKPIVDKIVDSLKKSNILVWYDKFEIRAGDNIPEAVNKGLKNSKYFIFILSPNSLSSSWVTEEASYAILQQIALSSVFIIPVLIADCEIPPLLKARRYIDFRSSFDNGIKELIGRLNKDEEILARVQKEVVTPWPDISKDDNEYVYLFSNRFDKVFTLPCSLSESVSRLINYVVDSLKLPWNTNMPELGMRWSFSYSIVYDNHKIFLSQSLSDAGVKVGDTIQLSISGIYEDLWDKELKEMWSGDKLYEVGGAMRREAELNRLISERGPLTQDKLKEIAKPCFSHV
jgi:hypothetical protein